MKFWISAAVLGGVALTMFALSQQTAIRQLCSEVALLKNQLGAAESTETSQLYENAARHSVRSDTGLGTRLVQLEQRVEELGRTSEHLMDRGLAPLSRAKADAVVQTLMDPSKNERDRVMAVRLLLGSNMFDDTAAGYVASLLPTMTDTRLKRELLQQLDGATNAVLKTSLMQLASDSDSDVRGEVLQRLSRFAGDPQVEQQLWNALRDSDSDVRRTADGVLRRLPATESAMAVARERGLSPDSTLEERFTALQLLQNGNQDLPELANALAQAALDNNDPETRMRILRGFDHLAHPSFVSPLVQSLQDPSPAVRREAADALSSFRDDPVVHEWLQQVAQVDTDPGVREEASDALRSGNRGRWR